MTFTVRPRDGHSRFWPPGRMRAGRTPQDIRVCKSSQQSPIGCLDRGVRNWSSTPNPRQRFGSRIPPGHALALRTWACLSDGTANHYFDLAERGLVHPLVLVCSTLVRTSVIFDLSLA